MSAKIHNMSQIQLAVYALENLKREGIDIVGLATLGNLALNEAAEMAIQNNPKLELRFNPKGVDRNSGSGWTIRRAIAYLRFMGECAKKGACACGDPLCHGLEGHEPGVGP